MKTKNDLNYFDELIKACNQLDVLGQKYLDLFDFLPNDEICERIHQAAKQQKNFNSNDDWDLIPDWAATILDGGIPYSSSKKNGSLFHALGFSAISQDAHLRNLLEIAEGREKEELNFPVIVNRKEFHEKLNL